MHARPFLVHALSPVHAGVGRSADLIDLPIARMRATNIPIIPGSTIKGVLRDRARARDTQRALAVFGPENAQAGEHAGALVVGDAILLAMPVRSLRGTFAWVSAPLLLQLARRDLGWSLAVPKLGATEARVTRDGCCVVEHDRRRLLCLEDLDLEARADPAVDAWAKRLAAIVYPEAEADLFGPRFVVVDDETMGFLLETATQLDTRVRIDDDSGTVAAGALWLEESLPAESLLFGLMTAERSRRQGTALNEAEVLAFALDDGEQVQLGGKASVGRGRCRLLGVAP